MARTAAQLPKGTRITDHISLGVIAKCFPREKIEKVLSETGKASKRHRNMPAHVTIYYVIAMALYMHVSCKEVLRCLLEGVRWLMGSSATIKVTCRSGISQARVRLGDEALKKLHDQIVAPIAIDESKRKTKGAWYHKWLLVSIDGSTLDVADTKANEDAFGRPGASRGKSAYPQIRFVSLAENGTHVLFGSKMGPYHVGEVTMAKEVIGRLKKGMLCLADRNFFSFKLWKQAKTTGAELLWRMKKNMKLPCLQRLEDGSFLSKIYASDKDRRHDSNPIVVRVIEYKLKGVPDAEPLYRLITTILDHKQAPAIELAQLYSQRWEIESAFDEFKTHLRGSKIVLRSKRPDLVRQEFYGFMMAHFAIRGIMHEAALKADEDPDRLSFAHSVSVIRRKLPQFSTFSPSGKKSPASSRD